MKSLRENFKTYFFDSIEYEFKHDWLLMTSPFNPNFVDQKTELEKGSPFFKIFTDEEANSLSYLFITLVIVAKIVFYTIFFFVLKILCPFDIVSYFTIWILICICWNYYKVSEARKNNDKKNS